MIPKFPEFKYLELSDYDFYNKLVSKFDTFSDLQFATLQIWWNLAGDLKASILNENLVIYYHNPFDEHNSGYSIIGMNDINASLNSIFSYLKKNKLSPVLVHVPEFTAKLVDQESFTTTEEMDYMEYVLDAKELSEHEGKKFESFRRKLNHFEKVAINHDYKIKALDLSTEKNNKDFMDFIDEMYKKYLPKNDIDQTERLAIAKSLTQFKDLGLKNLSFYFDDRLIATVIYESLVAKSFYIGHHLKADYEIPYITDVVNNEMANQAIKDGIKYINIEMDLGIENIRKHKMSLHPSIFLKKYRLKSKRA